MRTKPLGRRPSGRSVVVPQNEDIEPPDPRFTQANERTYLAWVRTALAFIAGGLAVEQLLDSGRAARLAVSIPLILLGGFMGVAGYLRFKQAEEAIRRGEALDP